MNVHTSDALLIKNARRRTFFAHTHAQTHRHAMTSDDNAQLLGGVFAVFLGLSLAFVSIVRPASSHLLVRSVLDAVPFVVVPLLCARVALASVHVLIIGNAFLFSLWTYLVSVARSQDVSDTHRLLIYFIPPSMTITVLQSGLFYALPSIPRAFHDLGMLLIGRPSYAYIPYLTLCVRRRVARCRTRHRERSCLFVYRTRSHSDDCSR